MCMWSVAINGHDSANTSMIKGEGPKMFAEEDDGKTLIFIRAESPGRHYEAAFKSKRQTEVV